MSHGEFMNVNTANTNKSNNTHYKGIDIGDCLQLQQIQLNYSIYYKIYFKILQSYSAVKNGKTQPQLFLNVLYKKMWLTWLNFIWYMH